MGKAQEELSLLKNLISGNSFLFILRVFFGTFPKSFYFCFLNKVEVNFSTDFQLKIKDFLDIT